MKPFTVAIAIEAGKMRPNTLVNTEHGVYTVNNRKIHDQHPAAMMTVSQIIQRSSNIGSAKVALSLKSEMLWQGLSDSGFGVQTGSNIPGEASGKLREPRTWRPNEQATLSYGHGISVSLLQLARAYTIFANDGALLPVSMIKQDMGGVPQAVFSATKARAVRDMLELVVQPGGNA